MGERVTLSQRQGVTEVRLNRPDKLNALDPAMFEALIAAGEALQRDSELRAVVLCAEGRAFCAGLDFPSFMTSSAGSEGGMDPFARGDGSLANHVQRAAFLWKELPVPVVAALQGEAFGGGLQIALGADMRYAAADLRMSVMEIRWGLIPDMSGSQTLRELVRMDVAKELSYTGRIVAAEEAARLGLVTAVVPDPLTRAHEVAAEIAERSPSAVRAAKRLFEQGWHGSVQEGLRLEERLQRSLLGTPEQLEAVQANLRKRKPR